MILLNILQNEEPYEDLESIILAVHPYFPILGFHSDTSFLLCSLSELGQYVFLLSRHTLLSPLPSGENLLVVVDYFSRYFEVVILRSTTSAKIIES